MPEAASFCVATIMVVYGTESRSILIWSSAPVPNTVALSGSIGKSNGLFRRPGAPIPCHLVPLPLVPHTPWRGARQGVPAALRAPGSHPRPPDHEADRRPARDVAGRRPAPQGLSHDCCYHVCDDGF